MLGLGNFSVLGGGMQNVLSLGFAHLKVPNQFTFLLPSLRILWLSLAPFPGFIAVLSWVEELKTGSHHLVWTGSDSTVFL